MFLISKYKEEITMNMNIVTADDEIKELKKTESALTECAKR